MKGTKKEDFADVYYSGFHGFEKLEREFRADGWFHGQARDYARCKQYLIQEKPRNCLVNQVSSCYFGAPIRTFSFLKNTVAIVHGPQGCGGAMYLELCLMRPKELVCTMMDEQSSILGGEQRLKESIQDVIRRFNPDMIGVIGTCTSSIIGDDIQGICETMELDSGIPIIAFDSPGFKHRNWNLGFDESFNKIIDRMEPSLEKNKGSINFFNPPTAGLHWKEFYEILPYLIKMGIKINTHAPCFLSFNEFIKAYPRAELNVIRCAGTGMQSAEYAEKVLGIPYLRVVKPVSIKYTNAFLLGIADFFGCTEKTRAMIQEEQDRIKDHLEQLRRRLRGKRVAITAGPSKNIALAQVAYELGMEVVYLGPVKADSLYHETLQEWLETTGQDPEVMAEESIYEGEAILSRLRPDIYLGLPEERIPMNRMGIITADFLTMSIPQLTGYDGLLQVGEYLAAILENRLLNRWGRHLWRRFPPFSSPEYLATSPLALGS